MPSKIPIILTQYARRKLSVIRAHQDAQRARALADPAARQPSAWEAQRRALDKHFDQRNNCFTVRDYRVLG